MQGSLPPIRMCFPRRKLTNTGRWFPDVQNNEWTHILCWHTRPLHNIKKRQCRVTKKFIENTNCNNVWLDTLSTQPKTDTAQKAVEQDEEKQAEVVRPNIGDRTEQALEGSLERGLDVVVRRACVHRGRRREDCTAWWVGVNESSPGERSQSGGCFKNATTRQLHAMERDGPPECSSEVRQARFPWFIENE